MISSHLEPSHARRVFPCWDEPAFKATFALTVTVPRRFLAVSNMPVAHEEPVTPDLKQVTLRHHAENVELPVRAGGGRARTAHGGGRRRHRQRRHHHRQARARPLRARQRGRPAALLQRLFRRQVSAAQARPDRGAGRLRRRHGELGRHHLLREPAAVRSGGERRCRAPRHFQHRRPRDRASMVRQSRHHGLVGQSLAQRGLRHLDAGEGGRASLSAMADLAQRQRAEADRHEPRCPAHLASGAGAGHQRDRGDGGVRRHHLQQECGADPHARALSGRGRFPRRDQKIHGRSRLRQHHHRRPVAGARGRLGQAGRRHRRRFHRAGGRAAGHRAGALRRRRAAHHAAPGALHGPRPGRGAAALAGAGGGRSAARSAGRRNRRARRRAEGDRSGGAAASR